MMSRQSPISQGHIMSQSPDIECAWMSEIPKVPYDAENAEKNASNL